MIKPLSYFHDLDHQHRHRVIISDLEEEEMEKLYPKPDWCTMNNVFDKRLGCQILMCGYVYDDNNLCKTCMHYKKGE